MLLGLFGLQFVLLGIVAEYAGMIFHEVRGRQAYLIRTTHGVAAVPDGRQRLPAEPVPSANGRTAGHPG